ncbi:hypothetical protein CIB48_g3343 [Xylaria polymorpha]|nr:hypothetical protein CIB48_g3343 [Xylaria polymorpha]
MTNEMAFKTGKAVRVFDLPKGSETRGFNVFDRTSQSDVYSQDGISGLFKTSKVTILMALRMKHISEDLHFHTLAINSFEFYKRASTNPTYIHSNGFFGYEHDYNDQNEIIASRTWLKRVSQTLFEPTDIKWRDTWVFTHWDRISDQSRILIISDLKEVTSQLSSDIKSVQPSKFLSDPLWVYSLLYERLVDRFGWESCQVDRDVTEKEDKYAKPEEHDGSRSDVNYFHNYSELHITARRVASLVELLHVDKQTLDSIIECHESVIDGLKVAKLVERIQNQIQLAYNLTAAGLAEATRKDSQAMIAIAFITLVFLPPTFISTVFSTSFFDFGDGGIVSRKFWVYWVVTVPITVFVNYLWYRYIISGPKEMRRQHMERLKAKLPWSTEDIAQVIP